MKRGYTGIRRYQLGVVVWRALGNTVQTDLAGVRHRGAYRDRASLAKR